MEVDSIKIVKSGLHPFLRDHARVLTTVDRDNQTISEVGIYPDSGAGCEAYLFDSALKYILVDCNGQWFDIDKVSGAINTEGWKWGAKLPESCLGKFQSNAHDDGYKFVPVTNLLENEVYKYKDPDTNHALNQE